jgi:hypothetical protein
MLRRFPLTLILLAVVALPATAQHPHAHLHRLPHVQTPTTAIAPQPSSSELPWLVPAFRLISFLVFLFGAVPGIIAKSKGMPNWKKIFFWGLFFGFLFFPVVLVLLYKVLKYESPPINNQAAFRQVNPVQVASQTQDVTLR